MKKWIFTLFLPALLWLTGCGKEAAYEPLYVVEDTLPPIVFWLDHHNCEKTHEYNIWFIDRDGNVYRTWQFLFLYDIAENGKIKTNSDAFCRVGQIDKGVLLEKYLIAWDMAKNGNTDTTAEFPPGTPLPDLYCGEKSWVAFVYDPGYDSSGEETGVGLYDEDQQAYYNDDPRAQELADWMTDVFSQYPEFEPLDYLYR